MLATLTLYAPQLLAAALAVGGALGLNLSVTLAKVLVPTQRERWKPLYGMLPHVIGASAGYWVWQEILTLASTGIPAIEAITWSDYPLALIFMGLGQGASAQSLYEFYKTSVMGPGGIAQRMLERFGGAPPALSASDPFSDELLFDEEE